jgi:hypothetical protein
MRERLHSYTKRTLGAGGSYNDAVSVCSWVNALLRMVVSTVHGAISDMLLTFFLSLVI